MLHSSYKFARMHLVNDLWLRSKGESGVVIRTYVLTCAAHNVEIRDPSDCGLCRKSSALEYTDDSSADNHE